ncbi:hypothetical protein BH10ACT7_BH10ACT7_31130 [soil metagenome]
MSETPPNFPAAWYPDPAGGPRQRYWDGTQWTEHFHPPLTESVAAAAAAPVADTVAPKKRGKGKLIAIIAGGTAVVIGLTSFLVWGLPALTGSDQFGGATYTEPDWEYAFTQPVVIEPDTEIEFDVNYNLPQLAEDRGLLHPLEPSLYDASFAFEVFTDAALTLHAEVSVTQYDPEDPVSIRSYALSEGRDKNFNDVRLREGDGFEWGLDAEYYLVRKLDADGLELDKPIVTKFTVQHELAAPVVTFTTPENNGNLTMEWPAVDGATEYIIVTSYITGGDPTGSISRIYTVLDQVTDTSWSSSSSAMEADVAPWLLTQNDDMNLFRGGSADSIKEGFSTAGDETEFTYGVIATNGESYSGFYAHNGMDVAAALPFETAFGANRDLKVWGPSGFIEGIENVQTTVPFTSLDGQTRSTVAYIDPAETVDYGNRWVLSLRGRGTELGVWAPVTKDSVPDLAAAIDWFNARAEELAPPTGMPTFDVISAPMDELANGIKEAPDTDYPIYGSSEFVKFIAQHMIAQTPVIDISDYADQPGVPKPYDAAQEAMYQNPYVINVEGLNLNNDGDKLYVSYYNSEQETVAIQEAIFAKTNEVVDAVVTEGMSDAQIVTALNDWLVNNSEYDYAALAASDANVWGGLPAGYENAWNAKGNLVDGIGVCASYSYAFNALANAAGVETVVINGDVLAGGAHAWNKVYIDGAWYSIDVTWNDSPDVNRYLLISDSGFTDSATRVEGNAWITDLLQSNYATP